MAIIKPSWLHNWLSYLNWDILSWNLYIGDAIESAIDWVCDGLTWIQYLAESAWDAISTWWSSLGDWWGAVYQTVKDWVLVQVGNVTDWFTSLFSDIWRWIFDLANTVSTWWDSLGAWWAPIYQTVKDWVLGVIEPIIDIVTNLINPVLMLKDLILTAWDLATGAWDFAMAAKAAVDQLNIDWGDLFNWWGEFSGEVSEFFADPLEWVYNWIDEWFERYW